MSIAVRDLQLKRLLKWRCRGWGSVTCWSSVTYQPLDAGEGPAAAAQPAQSGVLHSAPAYECGIPQAMMAKFAAVVHGSSLDNPRVHSAHCREVRKP